MKDLIGAVLVIVGLYAGTATLKTIHNTIRKAALEKATQGLPSLTEMNSQLRNGTRQRQKSALQSH